MRRWGWLTSVAVITGPVKEWQPVRARPLGEVATMKATHSDSHSLLSTPVIAAQPLQILQSDMQYLFTYQNAKSAANREVNMEIITIRVSTNTATEQRAQHRNVASFHRKEKESRGEAECLGLHQTRFQLRREHSRFLSLRTLLQKEKKKKSFHFHL